MTSFTKQQLVQVRNEIDIDWLINETLSIERHKTVPGDSVALYAMNSIPPLRKKLT